MLYRLLTILLALSVFNSKSHSTTLLDVYGKDAMSSGIYILDLLSDSVLVEHNSNMVFTPASITKALTSATALSLLPKDFRFKTEVMLQGIIKGSTLYGNIIINATGDATLESIHFPNNIGFTDSIVYNLKQLGISTIEGKCQIIPTNYNIDCGVNPNWEIEDIAWAYGAGLYPFNYKNNSINISITGSQIKTNPYNKDLSIILYPTNAPSSVELLRPFYSNDLYIQGLNSNTYSTTCSMPYPEDVFIDELNSKLSQNGIIIKNCAIENINHSTKKSLYTHSSPPINDILKSLMIRSDNLFAESILRIITPNKPLQTAISTELNFWKENGINTDFISIKDGSGLARTNRISPIFMAEILKWMANSKNCDTYIGFFPRAGLDGTLKQFLKGTRLEKNIVLKTGSMNGVQCYAGYKLNDNNKPTHIIVVMVNNFFCKRTELRLEIEKMLLNIL